MDKPTIKYKSGYKYQLVGDYTIQTRIITGRNIKTEFIELTAIGELTLKSGYASDGPSGPTKDTNTFIRGAFGHDGKYQLLRMGLIGNHWREIADQELRADCLKDGMNRFRAWYVYKLVQICGKSAADPANRMKVRTAP